MLLGLQKCTNNVCFFLPPSLPFLPERASGITFGTRTRANRALVLFVRQTILHNVHTQQWVVIMLEISALAWYIDGIL